jgi:hypothetical protein
MSQGRIVVPSAYGGSRSLRRGWRPGLVCAIHHANAQSSSYLLQPTATLNRRLCEWRANDVAWLDADHRSNDPHRDGPMLGPPRFVSIKVPLSQFGLALANAQRMGARSWRPRTPTTENPHNVSGHCN